jgi:Transposase DDE domain
VRKGYLKIHVAVDIRKRKIVSLDVISEEVYDGSRLKELVLNASENNTLKRVVADGAYDNNNLLQMRLWTYCSYSLCSYIQY